jgi:hypothetical protein
MRRGSTIGPLVALLWAVAPGPGQTLAEPTGDVGDTGDGVRGRIRPGPFCHDHARQWLPIHHFYLSEHKRCVTVTALGQTRSAGFLNRREGCRLDVC